MVKIVFASLDKIDFRNTIEKVNVIESVEQLINTMNEDTTYISAIEDELLKAVENSGNEVFIPSTRLSAENQNLGWHVYFELENYPFYQKAKEIIGREEEPRGVLRFRRMVKQNKNLSLLTGDLYVLSSLLGEPEDVQVKQTNQSITPSHTIIMMNFGRGTMAHIEYTVSDQERIELEWSGIKHILEFDSDQMRPIQPGNETFLPLAYSIDNILASARRVDQKLIERMNYLIELIKGGAHV